MHYAAVVLLPQSTKKLLLSVAQRLEPYNEEMKVEPYEIACDCIGEQAWQDADKEATERCGPPKTFDIEWQTVRMIDYDSPYMQVYLEAFKRHPLAETPNPECEKCGGSGTKLSTIGVNPEGAWDWWQIGGRYEGFFQIAYDPDQDPINLRPCPWCDGNGQQISIKRDKPAKRKGAVDTGYGSGTRTSQKDSPLSREAGNTTGAPLECARCAGAGHINTWPEDWKQFGDAVVPVRALPDDTPSPRAVVTPDGNWYEMPDDATATPEEREAIRDEWTAYYRELLKGQQDQIAVLCDMHFIRGY